MASPEAPLTNLVAKLRKFSKGEHVLTAVNIEYLCGDAANEIERLRNIFEAIRTGAIKPEETRGAAMEALRNFSHEPAGEPEASRGQPWYCPQCLAVSSSANARSVTHRPGCTFVTPENREGPR